MTVEERVQKILSAYGVCSRREAERLMEPYAAGDGFAVLGVRG